MTAKRSNAGSTAGPSSRADRADRADLNGTRGPEEPGSPGASEGPGSPDGAGRRRRRTRLPGRFPAGAERLPRWWLLPSCALLGAALGGAYGVLTPPEYTATSYVIAVPTDKSDPATALGFAQAYGRVATQLAVLGDAEVRAGVPAQTLRDSVHAATSPDAPMVAISATSSRPGKAADIANAVSRSLTVNANRTEDDTRVQLIRFSRATAPLEPASLPARMTTLMGGCAGGLLGGLVLLARPRRRPENTTAAVPGPAVAADLHGTL